MAETVKVSEIELELQRLLEPTKRVNDKVSDPDLALHLKYLNHAPQVKCADGFEMSVQASMHHYCTPRDSAGPWIAVEVGFPTAKVDAFMPYIEGGQDDDPTDTVYGYVPLSVVAQAVADHGGFASTTPQVQP